MSAEQLPALIDRATRCLAEARTSAEVLEAKAAAEAALHYAKITKAANETQANCLRMIIRAETRMADEIDRGQANGEVARADGSTNQWVSEARTATFEDLGIDRRRVAEWREIRDAGPAFVEKVITRVLAEDRAPTKADIRRAVNGTHSLQVMGSSTGDEWYTPQHIADLAVATSGDIDLDPCWHPESPIKASTTYTIHDDGLVQHWSGRVWLNPPYGRAVGAWIGRLVDEYHAGRVTEALALIPARVDTEWFRLLDPFPRCFPYGRLIFSNSENTAPFPSAIPYLGPNLNRLLEVFGPIGGVWVRLNGGAI
jgi:DNA N-6-adenine-methyltransferase (Dam)